MALQTINDFTSSDPEGRAIFLVDQINMLVHAVNELSRVVYKGGTMRQSGAGTTFIPDRVPQIRLGTLDGDLEANNSDQNATEIQYENGGWGSIDQPLPFVTDPMASVWLGGERHAFFQHAGGISMIPVTNFILGVLTEQLDAGSTASVAVYESDGTGFSDSGKTVQGWDWMLSAGGSIEVDVKVVLIQHRESRRHIIVAASCPE